MQFPESRALRSDASRTTGVTAGKGAVSGAAYLVLSVADRNVIPANVTGIKTPGVKSLAMFVTKYFALAQIRLYHELFLTMPTSVHYWRRFDYRW